MPSSAVTGHTVTFNENLLKGTSLNDFEASTTAKNLTSFNALSPAFAQTGYIFTSWNTQPNGSGTAYQNGALYSFQADITLYAQWEPITHAVTFFENGSASDTVSATETGNAPKALTLFANLTPKFSKTGYSFAGWNTNASGTGTKYSNGQSYSFAAALTLYAQWTKVATAATTSLLGVVPQANASSHIEAMIARISATSPHTFQVVEIGHGSTRSALAVVRELRELLVSRGQGGATISLSRIKNPVRNLTEVFAS